MFPTVFNILFKKEPATFETTAALKTAVEKLQKSTERTLLATFFKEAIIGIVSEGYIRLYRYRPFFQNSFAPIFTGKFRCSNGVTVLEGHFAVNLISRIFMMVWFGFIGIFILLAGFQIATKEEIQASDFLFLIFPVLLIFFGIGLLKFGTYFGESDKSHISKVIREAIRERT